MAKGVQKTNREEHEVSCFAETRKSHDRSGPEQTPQLLGKKYVMIVKDDLSQYALVYSLERKPDTADVFKKFLASVRADGVPLRYSSQV